MNEAGFEYRCDQHPSRFVHSTVSDLSQHPAQASRYVLYANPAYPDVRVSTVALWWTLYADALLTRDALLQSQSVVILYHFKGLWDVVALCEKFRNRGYAGDFHRSVRDSDINTTASHRRYCDAALCSDGLDNFHNLCDIYRLHDPLYRGPRNLPLLWDKQLRRIVSNDFHDVMRILAICFDRFLEPKYRERPGEGWYPDSLERRIGRYAGSLERQAIGWYPGSPERHQIMLEAVEDLHTEISHGCRVAKAFGRPTLMLQTFQKLAVLEMLLRSSGNPFLYGDRLTFIDLVLFPVLVRFDYVYRPILGYNRSLRNDYPCLQRWLQRLYWDRHPALVETPGLFSSKIDAEIYKRELVQRLGLQEDDIDLQSEFRLDPLPEQNI